MRRPQDKLPSVEGSPVLRIVCPFCHVGTGANSSCHLPPTLDAGEGSIIPLAARPTTPKTPPLPPEQTTSTG
ncbi:hypothetical protein VZT92_016006 [Zoarces viviparus]|uniref:Uncharacterized protein n=1 Tax=Zoarces viviparus TaxID=48416 RepID=A0AAW1ET89_ZOAVI